MRRLGLLAALGLLAVADDATAQPVGPEIGDFPFVLEQPRPAVTGPVDQRFFGTYCQPSPKEFCKSVLILPDPCVTLRDMRVELDHLTSPKGDLLVGGGRFVLDGDQGVLGIAGSVVLLVGSRTAGGRTLFLSTLVPGNHHVTFTVTDSGGLSGQASLDISVVNRPPETPQIFLPAAGATLVAGAPVLFQGNALDPDSGILTGSALAWSAELQPGGPFVALGAGSELGTIFAAPADPVRIRLTAADGTGLTSQAEQQVRVIQGTGNAPPVVAIRVPNRLEVSGPLVAGFFAPQPAVPNPAPVTGTLAPEVLFSPGASAIYRVIFRATDRGGLTTWDSIEIFVTPSVIL